MGSVVAPKCCGAYRAGMRALLALSLAAALTACSGPTAVDDDGELTVTLANAIGWHPYLTAEDNVVQIVEYDLRVVNTTRWDFPRFDAGVISDFISGGVNRTAQVGITLEGCPDAVASGATVDCTLVVDWWVTKTPTTGSNVEVYFWWQGRQAIAFYDGVVTLVDGPY